jgi:hypothetical protein
MLARSRSVAIRMCIQELSNGGGKRDQRCAGVKDDTSVVHLGGLLAKCDRIKVNLPVRLAPQGKLDELASVVALVDAAESSLGLLLLVGIAEVESEHGLVEQALLEHVVERRHNALDADGVVAETHDAIEPAESKGETGLRGGLSEVLVLHLKVADLEDVVGNVTAQLARAVLDLELGAVLLVRRRRRRIVLGVQVAGDRAALGSWDPKVGATGVENDLERLRWRTEGDL